MGSVTVSQGDTTPYGRPLRVALDGDGTVIAKARRLAAGFLTQMQADHGLPVSQRALDVTRLVVSELVTNAHKYAPGPILLSLCVIGAAVEVQVWDSGPALPVARAADADRVGQHGLEIVMAVAQSVETRRDPVGKRVTARIALSDLPGGPATPKTRAGGRPTGSSGVSSIG
ncbi:ATP-binding protein [Streptomyces sp. JB150]|uniref:ATP-binding protein n=1 Tax=Streptomyces sp. JB150 TaxID=2714844 RepID=UPI00140768FA|nr:ATP-binding protein [Streptomyces sp. JB150]QIJ61225.1 ATP-binding protein [Streptomyces sp. JB150]